MRRVCEGIVSKSTFNWGREIYLNEIGEDAILALFISCIFGLNRPKFLNTCSLLGKAHVYDRHRP